MLDQLAPAAARPCCTPSRRRRLARLRSGPAPSSRSATRTPARGATRSAARGRGPGQWLTSEASGRASSSSPRAPTSLAPAALQRRRPRSCAPTTARTSSCSARSRRAGTSRTRARPPGRHRARAARQDARARPRLRRLRHRRRRRRVAVRQVHAPSSGCSRARPRRLQLRPARRRPQRGEGRRDPRDGAESVADSARRLGVDTFVLDDGWQASSGDWHPDSPAVPRAAQHAAALPGRDVRRRPRGDRADEARPVDEPDALPPVLKTSPSTRSGRASPSRRRSTRSTRPSPTTAPTRRASSRGAPTRSRSSRAASGRAITEWGVTYFKFDFLAWLDCAGQGDFHHFRDAFVAMLDRLRADHPAVTLQIDETNDYRLFPFASTTRGPTWFQNGNPEPDQPAAQPLEPQPVRPVVRARPARARRRRAGSAIRCAPSWRPRSRRTSRSSPTSARCPTTSSTRPAAGSSSTRPTATSSQAA